MGFVLVLVSQAAQQDVSTDHNMCVINHISANSTTGFCLSDHYPPSNSTTTPTDTPKDLSNSLLIYATVGVSVLVLLALLAIGFRPKLKRLEVEERAKLLIKLQQEHLSSASVSTLSVAIATESHVPDQIQLGDVSPLQLIRTIKLSEHNTTL